MTPTRAVRRILICGGGTAGWMSAAALARMLPLRKISVTLVQSSEIGTVGVGEATIPPIVQFNRLLGLDEHEFLAATNATLKLGIEFTGWLQPGHSYLHPFGLFGADMHEVSFHHFWRRAVENGMTADLAAFNAEMQVMRAGAVMRPGAPLNYAYQFDAASYADFLRSYAEARGVTTVDGVIAGVARDSAGAIDAVELQGGRRLEADFFIDCTGSRALLIGKTLEAKFEDWSRWLPCNRALALPSERTSEPAQLTRSIAHDWGWRWQIPLQHRTGNGMVYCDAFASDDTVERTLLQSVDGALLESPNPIRFQARHCVTPWARNCLAIGLSAGFLEPLESTSIHLIQAGILSFITMFPDRRDDQGLANRYNRSMARVQIGIRDFIVAHYKLSRRDDTPFWRHVTSAPIPDSLAERIELYRRRGEVFAEAGDLFKEANWFAVLEGMGVRARSWHPVADLPSIDQLRQSMDQIAATVGNRARSACAAGSADWGELRPSS